MLFKTKQTYVIASPMEGVLMKDGKPLANTKILRRLRWNSNDNGIEQEFMSDENGRFSLPIHEETLTLSALTQFVCSSHITINIDNEDYDIWYNNKFSPEIYAETNGPIEDLTCDISSEELIVRPDISRIGTICRWKNMPLEESDF